MDGDRLAEHGARVSHGDVAAQWEGAGRGGLWRQRLSCQRGVVRSGHRDVDGDRRAEHRTRRSHGDVAAQWEGAGRGGLWQQHERHLSSAELYDPATRDVDGDRRAEHRPPTGTRRRCCPMGRCWSRGAVNCTAVLLPARSCTIRPRGTWTTTGALSTARSDHTATLLPNGKVLVAGGCNSSSVLASAELYDPATGTWTATGSLTTARYVAHGDVAAQWQGAGRGGLNAVGALFQRGAV